MSSVVRLNVPPFERTEPTSLAALHRPLVSSDATQCEAHCNPCPACLEAQKKAVEDAGRLASDLGLRLSQLVEDALAQHVARMEAEQARLIATVLTAVLPNTADAALRSSLKDEISTALSQNARSELTLAKNPALDLGPLPEGAKLTFVEQSNLPLHQLRLSDDSGTTLIDPQAIIDACLARLSPLLDATSVPSETDS